MKQQGRGGIQEYLWLRTSCALGGSWAGSLHGDRSIVQRGLTWMEGRVRLGLNWSREHWQRRLGKRGGEDDADDALMRTHLRGNNDRDEARNHRRLVQRQRREPSSTARARPTFGVRRCGPRPQRLPRESDFSSSLALQAPDLESLRLIRCLAFLLITRGLPELCPTAPVTAAKRLTEGKSDAIQHQITDDSTSNPTRPKTRAPLISSPALISYRMIGTQLGAAHSRGRG